MSDSIVALFSSIKSHFFNMNSFTYDQDGPFHLHALEQQEKIAG